MSSSSGSTPRHPKRKATRVSYNVDQQPSDVDMSDGERETTRAKRRRRGVNKGRGKGKGKSARAEQSEDEESDSDSDASSERKRKKARKTTKGKGKKGARRGDDKLTSLPIELLTEICAYTSPGDLLHLSQTSKSFRKHLLDPESRSLWKQARERFEIPDLGVPMTEQQYAHLMFDNTCQCGKKAQSADVYLRKIFCKICRQKNWVENYRITQDHPDLHADASKATLRTPFSAKQAKWPGSYPRFTYLPDLEAISAELWELYPEHGKIKHRAFSVIKPEDEEDEEDKLLREILEEHEASAKSSKSTRTRQTRRPSFFGSASSAPPSFSSVKGEDGDADDEEDDEMEQKDGDARPEEILVDDEEDQLDSDGEEDKPLPHQDFLTERIRIRNLMETDGDRLVVVARSLRNKAEEMASEQRERDKTLGSDRRSDLETRILAEGEYSEADFTGAWYTSKIVNSAEQITDENWDTIKPKVIKLLARIKKDEAKLEVVMCLKERQEALRPRYEKLLRIQPTDEARYAFPLFPDFLHLDSVRPLWEPEDAKPEDDDVWAEHFDAVLEELDDFRISVRLRAVQMILAATTDVDEKELDNDADTFGPEEYDDDFLASATSFLVCSFPNCSTRGSYLNPGRLIHFGSLPSLLEHQHKVHSNIEFSDKAMAQRQKRGYIGDFNLPPLVVSCLSAIIELAGVEEPEKATEKDLDDLMGGPRGASSSDRCLFWENAHSKRRFSHWTELIEEAVKQSLRSQKDGRILEVPIIEFKDYKELADERAELAQQQVAKMLRKVGRKSKKKPQGRRRP